MFGCLVQLELEKTYDKQNPAYSDIIWKQFKNQYFVTLPAVVEEFHPGACYRKSSLILMTKGRAIIRWAICTIGQFGKG